LAPFLPLVQVGTSLSEEEKASMLKTGPLAERARAQELDFRRGVAGLEGSVASREQQQFVNQEALRRSLAEKERQ
jgi:hypothetical protein